jgi:hypothetical protein
MTKTIDRLLKTEAKTLALEALDEGKFRLTARLG